jgi:hypothetical protein
MIDVEQRVFTYLYDKVNQSYDNVIMLSEYVRVPPTFPCVQVQQISSVTHIPSQDSNNRENNVVVGFQVDVYTKGDNKKEDCKNIMNVIDEEFLRLGFSRKLLTQISNVEDDSIYRITARYAGIVSKEYIVYTN